MDDGKVEHTEVPVPTHLVIDCCFSLLNMSLPHVEEKPEVRGHAQVACKNFPLNRAGARPRHPLSTLMTAKAERLRDQRVRSGVQFRQEIEEAGSAYALGMLRSRVDGFNAGMCKSESMAFRNCICFPAHA